MPNGNKALTTLALPADLREAWEAVIAGSHCERMTRALYRVALGESYREAAKAEEYADHKDVWNLAKRYGLVQAKKEQILNGTRRVALLSNDELERRLVEEVRSDLRGQGVAAADARGLPSASRQAHPARPRASRTHRSPPRAGAKAVDERAAPSWRRGQGTGAEPRAALHRTQAGG